MPLFKKRPPSGGEGEPPVNQSVSTEASSQEQSLSLSEATVLRAPSVLPEAAKTQAELEEVSRDAIDFFEKARAEKGEFCKTVGQGDRRGVVLVEPITREVQVPERSGRPSRTDTYTDFVVLTPQGPVRFSEITGTFPEDDKDMAGFAKKGTARIQTARKLLASREYGDGVVAGSNITIYKDASSGSTEFDLTIPVPPSMKGDVVDSYGKSTERFYLHGKQHRDGHNAQYNDESNAGWITDETVVAQAVRASLEKVQSPVKAGIEQARAQIASTQAGVNALK